MTYEMLGNLSERGKARLVLQVVLRFVSIGITKFEIVFTRFYSLNCKYLF